MACGIYSITHIESGKRYIGQSIDMASRLQWHFRKLTKTTHKNTKLLRAVEKYGIDAFAFSPILITTPDLLTFYEQLLIDGYDSARMGYNVAPAADSVRGTKRSDEQKARISAAQIESRKRPDVILAMSVAIKESRRRPEVIASISDGTKIGMARPEARSRFMNAIQKDSYRTPRLENARSDEYRARVSEKVKATYSNEEVRSRHKAACSTAEYLKKIAAYNSSADVKKRRAESAKAHWADPGYKAMVSAKIKEAMARKRQERDEQ